jgi:hypothetical protein
MVINNHLTFVIKYFEDAKTNEISIISASAIPSSVTWAHHTLKSCVFDRLPLKNNPPLVLNDDLKEIEWTYSVFWLKTTSTKWGSRWDAYLNLDETEIGILLYIIIDKKKLKYIGFQL